MKGLEKFLLLKPAINKVTDGGMFRFIFAWFYRVLGALTLFGVFYVSWKLWGQINSQMPVKYFIGALLVQVFLVGLGYVLINILFIRANDIQSIPATKEYSVTPIIVICFKTIGELSASVYAIFGIALGMAKFVIGERMNMVPVDLPWLSFRSSGFEIIIQSSLIAFLLLFALYAIAELQAALVDIARNTSVMARTKKRN
ncbi:MAG: hypothetical protein OEZ13_13235 [Spirochaetia bacterium]|nr:hypothetical protein [Spirochaetia bacterium]